MQLQSVNGVQWALFCVHQSVVNLQRKVKKVSEVRSCSDLRKPTQEEISKFVSDMDSSMNESWLCGWCNAGQNEWFLPQMLFDPANEFMVTPCCHTEAEAALVLDGEREYADPREDDREISRLVNQ